MRSKVLLILAVSALCSQIIAQPNNWREDSPSDFVPITMKGEFDQFTEGARALKIIFTEDGTPYFVSDTFNVTADAPFSFSIDILDNDPGGEVNLRIRFVDGTGTGTNVTSDDYTIDNSDFQTATFTGTTPSTAVEAYVIIRMYDVAEGWTGSATFLLDNASYTENGGANLLLNPGFEDWPDPSFEEGSTLMDWRESSPSDFVPIEVVPELSEVSHGEVAASITFTETGTPYFVSDTFVVTPGSAFDFSIDVLDNDAGAEVNQRIRFIDEAGDGVNMTSDDYSVDNATYQTHSLTGTVPDTAVQAYVIMRMYDVSANWTGSSTFFLDNASYTEDGGQNMIPNRSFEDWLPPSGKPEFTSYKFEGLDPAVSGIIDRAGYAVSATVPFATDLTTLVATYELTEGATAKVGDTDQESGVTPNDFSSAVTYTLASEDGLTTQDWMVTISKEAPSTGNDIVSFRFEELDPAVNGVVSVGDHSVALEVPSGTDVTALLPTIGVSANATVSPESGIAQDFSSPVSYTVTAQDGVTQAWTVTVSVASAGKTTLFSEDFESISLIPEGWVIINNDGHTQAAGEERWQDSAWVVTTSTRNELVGTKVAMASSYVIMEDNERVDDWMILPAIDLGENSILSWQAMSTTSSGNYPDDYMVLIAPAVDGVTPTVAYFESEANILLTVAPESWSVGVGRPGEGLSSYSLNLKEAITPSAPDGWYDKSVWIAFVLITDLYTNPDTGIPNGAAGGSNLAIDNILVVNDLSTAVRDPETEGSWLSVFPNPSSGRVVIKMEAAQGGLSDITVADMLGKTVYSRAQHVQAGQNEIELDLSEMEGGIYFIKASVNGRSHVTKLIVN